MMPAQDHMIPAGDITLHCRVDGPENAPWIVFSNSLMTDLSLWDQQVSALQGEYRILRYDQRGHGKSGLPASPCDFDALSGDLLKLCDAFQIQQASFVGISLGAATVMRLGMLHPERVTRMVFCDSVPKAVPMAPEAWRERIELARNSGMGALADITVRRWFPESFVTANSAGLQHVLAMINTTPIEGLIACAHALGVYDFTAGLPSLSFPFLALAGEKDGALPEAMRAMCASIPGARFQDIPGSGHLPNIDNPEVFSEVLRNFLRE